MSFTQLLLMMKMLINGAGEIAKKCLIQLMWKFYRASDTTDTKVTAAVMLWQVGDVVVVGATEIC